MTILPKAMTATCVVCGVRVPFSYHITPIMIRSRHSTKLMRVNACGPSMIHSESHPIPLLGLRRSTKRPCRNCSRHTKGKDG